LEGMAYGRCIVTWCSVRRIIQRVVAEQRDERRELDGLRVIGMDEISYLWEPTITVVGKKAPQARVIMDLDTYKTETWAKKFLRGWLRRAMSSRIEPVKRAAKMIRSHFDGVIAWVTWRLSNGRLEGMNNKIRLLSHRSFGLHSAVALISLVCLNCG